MSTSHNAYLNHFKAEMVHGAWQLMTTSMATWDMVWQPMWCHCYSNRIQGIHFSRI